MKRSLTTLALILATAHCGGGDNSAAPASSNGDGVGAQGDAGVTGPTGDAACIGMGSVDDPDDEGIDANCDGADGVIGHDVYVNVATGADTNAGTPTEPLRTLAAAVAFAGKNGARVLVASGTYEIAELSGSAHVFGGYAPTFLGAPKRALTILHVTATGLLIDAMGPLSLAHLTVRGDHASDPKEPFAYGLRVKAGEVTLDDVDIDAGDALAGSAGSAGVAVAATFDARGLICDGAVQPSYTRGAGMGGRNAEGKSPGDLASKTAPGSGSAGRAGADGNDAPAALALKDDLFALTVGTVGQADGTAGYGGAGGASGSVVGGPYNGVVLGAGGGDGGFGGCPGKGGAGGTSGGSSVAVLLLHGSIHVARSRLHAGFGGAGGDGGDGGAGSVGSYGSMPVPLNSGVTWFSGHTTCPTPSVDPLEAGCAAYGGQGGDGGSGGHGGGGAGGSTIAIATASGASAVVDDATEFDLGRIGSGGTGHGGGRAPGGKSTRAYAIP